MSPVDRKLVMSSYFGRLGQPLDVDRFLMNATYGKFADSYSTNPRTYVPKPRPSLTTRFHDCFSAYIRAAYGIAGDDGHHAAMRELALAYSALNRELGYQIHLRTCTVCSSASAKCRHGFNLFYGPERVETRSWVAVHEDGFAKRLLRKQRRIEILELLCR